MDCCLVFEKQYKEVLWWSLFWSLLWGIWLKRNTWIFNQRSKGHYHVVINNAANFVGEWEKVSEDAVQEGSRMLQLVKVWKPPALGSYKINSDATLFRDNLEKIERDFMVEEV